MPMGINPTTGKRYDKQFPGVATDPANTANGMNPLGGWAGTQGFNPSELANTIYTQPFQVLPQVFKGLNTAGSGYQSLRDIGADPLTLYNIMKGSRKPFDETTGVGDYTNWLHDMYQTYGTRGGRAFSAKELLSTIFGQHQGGASALANILQGAGPGGEGNALYNLIRDVSAVGMNPLAAAGYNASVQRASDAFNNARITTDANKGANNMMVTDWIRQQFPGLMPT